MHLPAKEARIESKDDQRAESSGRGSLLVSLIYCSRYSIIGSSSMVIYSDYSKYLAHRCVYYGNCTPISWDQVNVSRYEDER